MERDGRRGARLSDVAEAAGVSKATVSNVFNRPTLVRDAVRDRVLAAAKAIGYAGPDPKGRMLSAGRANAIGVATAEPLAYFFEDPFARLMMAGISEVCDARGVGISMISASDDALAWNIPSALVDGLILFCLYDRTRLIAASRERGLPFVALAFDDADPTVPAIGIDDAAGARLAARHLVDLGHRRFAILAMEFDEGVPGRVTMARVEAARYASSRERVEGTFEVLAAKGLDTCQVPIFETHGDAASVWPALDALFALPEPPTAIVAQSDRIAMAVLDWLKAHGIAVPGDVSVVGFDGVPESALTDPPLTSVAQPIAEIGRRAARALLEPGEGVTREVLDVALVVRGSTGPPPA